jgi:hypothetical protein
LQGAAAAFTGHAYRQPRTNPSLTELLSIWTNPFEASQQANTRFIDAQRARQMHHNDSHEIPRVKGAFLDIRGFRIEASEDAGERLF